jgi:hypothetical protein
MEYRKTEHGTNETTPYAFGTVKGTSIYTAINEPAACQTVSQSVNVPNYLIQEINRSFDTQ